MISSSECLSITDNDVDVDVDVDVEVELWANLSRKETEDPIEREERLDTAETSESGDER